MYPSWARGHLSLFCWRIARTFRLISSDRYFDGYVKGAWRYSAFRSTRERIARRVTLMHDRDFDVGSIDIIPRSKSEGKLFEIHMYMH